MRDFVGMEENLDDSTRDALLDFSYYLTLGKMDEAHKAVKLIQNPAVWSNMAHMCVKTKRLDVAGVCLANMGNFRGAAALRKARKKYKEPEACVATVAIQLGMLNDAVRLLKECKRYDLLNQLYQDAGEWPRALDIASRFDRIHLKTTHHRYAQHLESLGDQESIEMAIANYESADTHRTEVPRMLDKHRMLNQLEDCCGRPLAWFGLGR